MTHCKRLLILGGTGDATELAMQATEIPGVQVITSLAGRTHQPTVLPNDRMGGFGGVSGLINYLQEQQIDLLIDATHPFAAQISCNAAAAAAEVGIPYLMLIRPDWHPIEGDRWFDVESNKAAAELLPALAQRIFLTIGRQELATFAHLQDLWFLMRMIDPPAPKTLVPPGKLILDRGPFALDRERALLQQHKIEAIVSKNSGGEATYVKIIAARELNLPVVMVQRPPPPNGKQLETLADALRWIVHADPFWQR
jgi:precorrin-6A/cobalt-precorrin-6A reductase